MGVISFGGLASGLDTESIIKSLVALRRQPIVRLQSRIDGYKQKQSAYGDVQAKMKTLLDAIQALDSTQEFASLAARSGNESLLTAQAGGLANPASYGITVNQLAVAQKERTQGFDSVNANVGSGTFSLTINGATADLELAAGASSLGDLKFAINTANLGVTATILNDGSETGGTYMVLSSEEEGTDAAFTLDTSGLTGGTTPVFTNVTPAQNAELVVDGITVTSQSNEISDVIEGVTFNLLDADPADPFTLDIQVDPELIKSKVQTFVDAYNELFSYIDQQSADDATLRGDTTVRSVVDRVQRIMTTRLSEGDITMLTQVGIKQAADGMLTFTPEDFSEKMAADFAGVRRLFIGADDSGGAVYLLGLSLDDMTNTEDGLFAGTSEALTARIDDANDTIDRYERSVASYEKRITAQFTAMEKMISMLQAQGSALSGFNVSQPG